MAAHRGSPARSAPGSVRRRCAIGWLAIVLFVSAAPPAAAAVSSSFPAHGAIGAFASLHPLAPFLLAASCAVTAIVLAAALRRRARRVRAEAHPPIAPLSGTTTAKLAFAAAHTPNAVLITDSAAGVEWVNDSFTRLTGLTAPEVIGRTFESVLEQIGAPKELVAANTVREDAFRFEHCVRRAGEPERWLLITGQPSHDATGQLTFWMVVANDVTALKQAQDTIGRRARQTVRYKSALLGLVQSDLSDLDLALGRITETAARALMVERVSVWFHVGDPGAIRCEAMYGGSTGSQKGHVINEAEHPRYFAALRKHQAIDADDAEHDPRTAELADRYLRPLGIRSMLDVPIWVGGSPIGVVCHEQVGTGRTWLEEDRAFANSVADVVSLAVQTAERKRAEAALRAEQQQARRIIMGAPIVIAGLTPDGTTTFINPAGERITGYPAAELVGRNWWHTFYSSDELHDLEEIGRAIECGAVEAYEKTLTTRSGERVTIAWDTINRYDDQGRIVEIIGFGRDVTARRQIEAEQHAAREAAETASRLKSEFLATVSHEIRTPLNGVIGMTDLLLDTPLAEDQRDYAETARRSADTLLSIINDILDFSKIEAGKLTLDEVNFELATVIEDAVGLVAEQAYGKGLEVSSAIAAGVPPVLRGDPGRLRQILANLLSNAVKFTGSGEVSVRVAAPQVGSGPVLLRIEVHDTGIGLSPDEQARIFRPFTQADGSTTRRYGGTGLGLAISKRLVELLQGDIGVQSTRGAGSTFWFTARLAAAPLPLTTSPEPSLQAARVLIVDRPCTVRTTMAEMIAALGCHAEAADDGAGALARLRAANDAGRAYHALVVNRILADMGGIEFARRVRADSGTGAVPVVLVTPPGLANDEAGHDAGIRALLVKPVRRMQLQSALLGALGGIAPRPEPAHAQPLHEDAAPGTRRILVAEDNPVNQKVAVKLLEKLGHRVDIVANGRDAAHAVARTPYVVVFMDCQMPDVDGFDATHSIRERERLEGSGRVPIVAMTANALRGDRERCLAAGMDDYIAKPISKESLQAVLDRWVTAAGPEAPRAT